MAENVRVRFAPSPTGGLHLGGIRTILYNYLFAKKNNGKFIVRIEDTDQSRFVPGAEQYIYDCLDWAGLQEDESPRRPGAFTPYRQSERKDLYREYALKLINDGHAYYAFDTPEELDEMRNRHRTAENPSPQYDHRLRLSMRNSLTLSPAEVQSLLDQGNSYVVRINMPANEQVELEDLIRGKIIFDSSQVDDKVLLKADGMPTYHLAVVVDDFLMQITHAFRGEEWLPSAPVHVLLWKYLFGIDKMPLWAHLPLILGPNGKLSKRDGAKYGFPVFAMNWTDPQSGELTEGFREKGFLPAAFINFLALLGWNDGSDKEIFSLEELESSFDLSRVHSSGAHFDFEKAKWFNHEWIKKMDAVDLVEDFELVLRRNNIVPPSPTLMAQVSSLVKDRCTLLTDFYEHAHFFFQTPSSWDLESIKSKWNQQKKDFFTQLAADWEATAEWNSTALEVSFKELATGAGIKPGELQLPLRIILVGGKFGPPVFDIASLLGMEETTRRIRNFLSQI